MTPLDALTIGPHVVRVLRALVRSVNRRSEGGRRITPDEAASIAAELRGLAAAVLRALGVPAPDASDDLRAALAVLRDEIGLEDDDDAALVRRATRLLRARITEPHPKPQIPDSVLDLERAG